MPTKEKKSFKKFAKKHLAGVIETRRKTAQSKKEKKERIERKKVREAKDAAREEREHVEQLERLKDSDPAFYSYLETEDPTLLEFDKEDMEVVSDAEGSDAETEVDEEEDRGLEDEGDDEPADSEEKEETARRRISQEELDQLVRKPNIERSIDVFVSALRELAYPVKEKPKPSTTRKFDDPSLVKASLQAMAQVVSKNVSLLVSGKGALKSPRTRYLVKRFLQAVTLAVAESHADVSLTVGLLQAILAFVPLLHFVKGMTKTTLKTALNLCASEEEPLRVTAYVVVRALATRSTGTRSLYQSAAFKGVFLTLVRAAFHFTVHNRSIVAFLINCVTDLYGTDMEAAYQHTFVYLRQLGIYLRAALQEQTPGNVRAVANWQFVSALRTWATVTSTYAEPSQLGPLIHPVVQIALGLMDLFSSPRMFPMHLHVVEILNHLSTRAEGLYIPVSPYLLRILTSPSAALSSSSSNSSTRGSPGDAELAYILRVKKTSARSDVYRRAIWEETLYLLTEHVATHSNVIGFPEVFWAVESTLKKIKADVKVPQIHSLVARLQQQMSSNAHRIQTKRDAVNFGPCDLTAVKQFEDQLRQSQERNPQGAGLLAYYHALRMKRVNAFTSQRKGLQSRETLDSAVEERLKNNNSNKRKRTRSS